MLSFSGQDLGLVSKGEGRSVRRANWMSPDGFDRDKDIASVRVRFWRPGFWLALLTALWYEFRNRFIKCDYACGWIYPYGFVPEDGCPMHDTAED